VTRLVTHVVLLVILPPLLLGVTNKVKAWFAGRVGPPLFQAYYDVVKLLQKGFVVSGTTTPVFLFGPLASVATALLAGLLVPLGASPAPVGFPGDPILFAYLFALGRFATTAAALDTGSAFEGMGAAREATFACLTEPSVLFAFLILMRLSGSLELSQMLGHGLAAAWGQAGATLVLASAALFVVLLAENCRIPFDDPNTHLELTMIHEVMVLDHSGPLFGLVLYGAAVKLFVFSSLVASVVAPANTGQAWLDVGIHVGVILLLAALIGVVESVMARLRLRHVPNLLVASCVLSAFGLLLLLR
jgi:formate hydrogenlyase subunit 4